jgi:heptaprenyl diphosphate synthase
MLTLIALGLSYIESLIPPLIPVPGIKVGLANIAVIFALYKKDVISAAAVSLIRVFISFLLFGSVLSLAYSLCGALFSLFLMFLLKKLSVFSEIGISVCGAIAHNVAQIAVACIIFSSKEILYYLPVLMISATVTGIVIGLISCLMIRKVKM